MCRSWPYSLLQEEPPNMMTGPSPNDYYNKYVINCVIDTLINVTFYPTEAILQRVLLEYI